MDNKTKPSNNIPHHVNEKIIRMEERLGRIWDCLLQMSDKIIEIKYLIKSQKDK